LVATGGYPYGLDNNESYSSWWHARSLYENGIALTKGLTDEVFAHHPEASPYIHSHQGNFPRLYTFLWYALGIRDIATHIWITTFTVGLAAIWFAFRFLSDLVRPGYAAIACGVMMTNYLLFAQWQVSLYNVWHAFFFFSSLRCIQTLGTTARRGRWVALALLNFASLFYWEYVFTAFVVSLCALYAITLHWRRPKTVLLAAGVVAGGAALAAGLLLTQLTAYMGWANVMEDVRLTLTARNAAADPALLEKVTTFYREHRIIFWHNFLDATPLRTLHGFWSTFVQHHLAYYSVPLIGTCALVLLGWLAGWVRARLPGGNSPVSGIGAAVFFLLGAGALVLSLGHGPATAGGLVDGWAWEHPGARVLLAGAGLLGLVLALRPADHGLVSGSFPILVACAVAAYALTFRLFTGYVLSGYLHRLVPLLVFVTDLLLALPLWLAWRQFQPAGADRILPWCGRAAAVIVLVGMLAQWFTIQAGALRLVPPDSYAFLKLLGKAPAHRRSVVTNTYPAPMVARAGSWGYADTSLFSGQLTLDAGGFKVERDLKYLWFADRETNLDYLKPDLALTLDHPPNIGEARQREADRRAAEANGLARIPAGVVRRAQSPYQPFLHHKLLHTDNLRLDIVDLDWDYPPYLIRHEQQVRKLASTLSLEQKLALSGKAGETRRSWRVEWQWLDQASPRASSPIDLWYDGRIQDISSAASSHVSYGDDLRLRIKPGQGRLQVTVNDASEVFDLARLPVEGAVFDWQASAPHGRFTRLPVLAPGFFVETRVLPSPHGTNAELVYRFAQQDGQTEAGTMVRLYVESTDGRRRLHDSIALLGSDLIPVRLEEFRRANPDTLFEYAAASRSGDKRSYAQWLADHLQANPGERTRPGILADHIVTRRDDAGGSATVVRLPLPDTADRCQFSITPGTRTKTGTEYFGLSFNPAEYSTAAEVAFVPPATTAGFVAPYGLLRLKLRFPTDRWPQSEPLLVTGSNEAGDIIYVIYHDEHHIRIGFDHWYQGGPLTQPIPIDFANEHELEISIGSLFPPSDDVVFVGRSAEEIAALKKRVMVRLNGETVLEAEGACYESTPDQVTIGRNNIRATSCGQEFHGVILSVERIWPRPE